MADTLTASTIPTQPGAPTVTDQTNSLAMSPNETGATVVAGSTTNSNISNDTPASSAGNSNELIKFSIGLDGIVSANAINNTGLSGGEFGASGGVGFSGGTGSATLSGEILTGGWISDEKLKQVAMEITCFHSVPVKKGNEYYMAADSIDPTGELAIGRFGQPSTFDKNTLEATKNKLGGKEFKVGASFGSCRSRRGGWAW